MSDTALRRTVRRSVAVVLIPLSLLPTMFVGWLHERGRSLDAVVLQVGDEVALAVLVGAVAYLVGSVALQLAQTSSVTGSTGADAR